MSQARPTALLIWAAGLAGAAWVILRAHYTADLSAFLPRTPTAAEQMLVDQLREGVASRLILVGIEGGEADERARVSLDVGRALRASALFSSVHNGEPVGVERDRQLLFTHRYLLSDAVTPQRFSVPGLHAAIEDSIEALASPTGLLLKSLLPADPTGEMLQILDQLGEQHQPRAQGGAWVSQDGRRALLVAQTLAAGSDTDAQEKAIDAIRAAFTVAAHSSAAPLQLLMSGPGVFSVAARATIKHEVMRLSVLSTVLILGLLFIVYRSFATLALGFIPVISGAIAGVAAVALGFGAVHGLTLGFGVTLIGESVDYSIYLFIQSRQQAAGPWQRSLWPTIRLGVLTSIVGFASLLPSAFPGLAQLGLYSVSGLVAAALVTRFVLPGLLPPQLNMRDVAPLGCAFALVAQRLHRLRYGLLLIPIAAAGVLLAHRHSIWNRELSGLSPVSEQDIQLDALLRTDIGAPDARYIVLVSGADEERVSRSAEALSTPLTQLVDEGVLAGFESPTRYLPSLKTQQQRRDSLPPPAELTAHLRQALEGLPLKIERLQPFLQDVESARHQPLLTRGDLAGSSLETAMDALMLHAGRQWTALLPLRAPGSVDIDLLRVRSALAGQHEAGVVVLDVKGEADRLYSTYLSEVLELSAAGFLAIIVLLIIALRSFVRALRVVAPLALAVLSVTAALVASGKELTILHVIGMLLIAAVGSNYALFFDRRSSEADPHTVPLTLASLLIANAATVLGFGVLAFSSVPVLSALGTTVAPGALLALLFSAVLARDLPMIGRTSP